MDREILRSSDVQIEPHVTCGASNPAHSNLIYAHLVVWLSFSIDGLSKAPYNNDEAMIMEMGRRQNQRDRAEAELRHGEKRLSQQKDLQPGVQLYLIPKETAIEPFTSISTTSKWDVRVVDVFDVGSAEYAAMRVGLQ